MSQIPDSVPLLVSVPIILKIFVRFNDQELREYNRQPL